MWGQKQNKQKIKERGLDLAFDLCKFDLGRVNCTILMNG